MRALAAVVIAALAAAVAPAADKNEDKAREAAVAFLKAVKAKDADRVMKAVAVPFAHKDGEGVSVIKEEEALRTWVKDRLAEVGDADKVPTEIDAVHAFADIRAKIKDEEQRKAVEGVVGKDGFVAVVTADGKMVPILVRVKDGKAAVVGLAR